MSLIEFPDVPNVAGVPALKRQAIGSITQSGITAQLYSSGVAPILNDLFGPTWAITDSNGVTVIEPDSVVRFEYRGEEKIVSHPVELGSFSSYNKVAFPFDIRAVMTCGGQSYMTREDFLTKLQSMKGDTNLYTFVTPDASYSNVNVEHVDYRRESSHGVSLLTVEIWLTEVRVTAQAAYSNTAQPSGTAQVVTGHVRPQTPSASQLAQFASAAIL